MFVFSKVSVSFDFFIFRTKPERIEAILGIRKKNKIEWGIWKAFQLSVPTPPRRLWKERGEVEPFGHDAVS